MRENHINHCYAAIRFNVNSLVTNKYFLKLSLVLDYSQRKLHGKHPTIRTNSHSSSLWRWCVVAYFNEMVA